MRVTRRAARSSNGLATGRPSRPCGGSAGRRRRRRLIERAAKLVQTAARGTRRGGARAKRSLVSDILQALLRLPPVGRGARAASDWVDLQLAHVVSSLERLAP